MSIHDLFKRPFKVEVTSIVIVIISVFIAFILFNQSRWNKKNGVIEWDAISYYAYLPATFIYNDLTLSFVDEYQGRNGVVVWYDTTKDGARYIRTSMGQSILYSPTFFIGHVAAKLFGYKPSGYTKPYKIALQFSALAYLMVGLLFLRKVLRLYFSDIVTAITIFIITICTNLLYYASIENSITHVYNFSIICIFLYSTHKWYLNPNIWRTITIGLLGGLIALIRPTNILIFLFFALFQITSFKGVKERLQLFSQKWYLLLIMAIAFVIVWAPQFIYWKYITGHWLYYSYGNSGGSFFWAHPHIIDGLFSYRKGWLLYVPVMAFSLIGIWFLREKLKDYAFATIVFVTVFVYVTFSWWSWWYGGGFGGRPMVDVYGVLAIPFAGFLTWLGKQKSALKKYSIITIFTLITFLSFFHFLQYKSKILHYDSMTKKAYWACFLKLHHPPGYWEMLCVPDYTLARKGIYVCNPVHN